jgi:acyl dehydratase
LDKRPSASRPDCGIVRLKHTGYKSDHIIVLEFERIVLFLKRPTPAT